MGFGNWCLIAKGFGCDVYGLDLSDSRMDRARELGIKSLHWDNLGSHKFDFINAEQVFEHLTHPLDTLIHLSDALKPGGVIRIGVPRGWDVKRRLEIWNWRAEPQDSDWLNMIAPLQHVNCYNYSALCTMGISAGLKVIEIEKLDAGHKRESSCERLKQSLKRMCYMVRHSKEHSPTEEQRGCAFFTR